MARVYLIRHGQPESAWGESDSLADPGLDALGRMQAEAACAALLALPQPPRLVITSPLRRCRETAAPFARALGIEASIDATVAEIPTPARVTPAARRAWLQQCFTGAWSDIDGDADYIAWRDAVARAIATRPGAAIFSHFVAINAAIAAATDDPRVLQSEPDFASVTVFETDGARLSLLNHGVQSKRIELQ